MIGTEEGPTMVQEMRGWIAYNKGRSYNFAIIDSLLDWVYVGLDTLLDLPR